MLISDFFNLRILFGAKESGAGSLLAELANIWNVKEDSLALTTEVSNDYFIKRNINTRLVENSATVEETIKIIKEVEPDILVVGASAGLSIEKKLIIAGQHVDVPVISFVDHYWNLWQRFAHEETAEKWFYKPDFIFVPASECIKRIISFGAPADKVAFFEHPLLLKRTLHPPQTSADDVYDMLSLPRSATIVLFVSEYNFSESDIWQWEQSSDYEIRSLLFSLLECASKFSNDQKKIVVLIKMHPAQKNEFQDIYSNFSEENYRILQSFDKSSLFQVTNVAFGLNSMLLLEAANFGIPSFSYYGPEFDNRLHLNKIHKDIIEISDLKVCNEIISRF